MKLSTNRQVRLLRLLICGAKNLSNSLHFPVRSLPFVAYPVDSGSPRYSMSSDLSDRVKSLGRTSYGQARSLSEFQKAFPDEASCVAFLFKRRWPDGFICPGCGERRAAVLKSRPRLYECLDCGRQTSITVGIAMHRSKLPLTAWFWAAHLMATHSNGMSARQLEDQLGVTYKTAWLLTQKLRRHLWLIRIANHGGGRRSRSDGDSLPRRRCVSRSRQCGQNPRHRRC